ncbi:MAG: PSD1 and planctomycete cytochrome C domain-containing protein [Rhodothermales bacterium]
MARSVFSIQSKGPASGSMRVPAFGRLRATRNVVFALAASTLIGCGGSDIDFNADVRPILNSECVSCHGGVRRKGDLNLLFREDALKPAKSGKAAIVPGDPDASELIRRVVHTNPEDRMPKDGPELSSEQVRVLKKWIADGAAWETHWAYVAPIKESPPSVKLSGRVRNGIDNFVLARLEAERLEPSPEADCAVLARRASLDLVGLPAAPRDIDALCGTSTITYEAYVDSLLASPHFGERWASMWLDLARYADSQGYEKDGPRSIWRYRDWVIDAFNANMPFDRFTVEQLAGDLLPDADTHDRIATAFLRNSMTNTEGGTDDEEHRVSAIIDRLNTTFEVWQSTSISCTQCHGHPYDPFRHDDYYKLFAFFNNTADWDQEDDYPVLFEFSDENEASGKALAVTLDSLRSELLTEASTPEMIQARQDWEQRLEDPKAVGAILTTWQNELLRIAKIPEADRSPAQASYATLMFASITPELAALRDEMRTTRRDLYSLASVTTPVARELREGERRVTHVFERGNFLLPAAVVNPDVPVSMPQLPVDAPRNRLGLAEWLVGDENTLTARVAVNRFWEQLFGYGIVETLEDFGTQGSRPSHPELLDWMAVTFRDDLNWDVKALLRMIVTSSTYRQSSVVRPDLRQRDPRNELLARGPRFRLSAEQVRDQALAVGGLLSHKTHGPSVMPPQPEGLWQNPYSNAKWETSEGEDRYRRAVYTYWRRSAPHPAMTTFDGPSREFCVSRRIRTNTPLQALVTLNDPAYMEAAVGLGRRVADEPDPAGAAYRIAIGREPAPDVLASLTRLYATSLDDYADDESGAEALVGQFRRVDLKENTRRDALSTDAPSETARIAAASVVANVIMNTDAFLTKD